MSGNQMSCDFVKSVSVCIGDVCLHRSVRNANNDLVEDDSLELEINRIFFAMGFPQTKKEPVESNKRKCDSQPVESNKHKCDSQ